MGHDHDDGAHAYRRDSRYFAKQNRLTLEMILSMSNSDKDVNGNYANLVTVIAVLIVVFYTQDKYDVWDAFLGFVGILLGRKYATSLKHSDMLFTFLVASLLALSGSAILWTGIEVFWLADEFKICEDGRSLSKVSCVAEAVLFTLCMIVVFIVLHFKSKTVKPGKEDAGYREPPASA